MKSETKRKPATIITPEHLIRQTLLSIFRRLWFYQYRNDLFQMKSGNYKLEQVIYERPLYPRYSAAMTIVGDELYIFGGRGNKYGKQELSSHFYLGLCAINLKTIGHVSSGKKHVPRRWNPYGFFHVFRTVG